MKKIVLFLGLLFSFSFLIGCEGVDVAKEVFNVKMEMEKYIDQRNEFIERYEAINTQFSVEFMQEQNPEKYIIGLEKSIKNLSELKTDMKALTFESENMQKIHNSLILAVEKQMEIFKTYEKGAKETNEEIANELFFSADDMWKDLETLLLESDSLFFDLAKEYKINVVPVE